MPTLNNHSHHAVIPVRWFFVIAALFASTHFTTTIAAPSDFDASFGSGDGKVAVTPLITVGADGSASGTMLLPDGKIVMAGRCTDLTSTPEYVCLTRHLANGNLDQSLNGSGRARFPMPMIAGEETRESRRAIRTSDGKYVIAFRIQNATTQALIGTWFVRLSVFGTLDGPFGGASSPGFVRVNGIDVYDLAPLPDGRFLAMGICPALAEKRCLTRINLDGSVDTTFGNENGFATTLVGDTPERDFGQLAVLSDGKIVQAVPCVSNPKLFCLLGYSSNGIADSPRNGWYMGFGSNGVQQVSIAVQSDGKLVVAGPCGITDAATSLCVARFNPLNPNAALASEGPDNSFSGDGQLVNIFVGFQVTDVRVAIDGGNRIVVAAQCRENATQISSLCVYRFNSDGTLDSTFAPSGRILRPIAAQASVSTLELPHDVLIQPDGKILIGAACTALNGNSPHQFCMVRLIGTAALPSCSLDIDGDGVVTRDVDALLHARATLRMTNEAALSGITFSAAATRKTYSDIIGFLVNSCGFPTGSVPTGQCSPDIDGDGKVTMGIDSLILLRVTAGLTQTAVTGSIQFPVAATRKTWANIRSFLVNQCGMTIAP